MKVSDWVIRQLEERLEASRIVVWYDAQRAFESLLPAFDRPEVVLVDARDSVLQARRATDAALQYLNDPNDPERKGKHLLVYTPTARSRAPEDRRREPFEALVRLGSAFGDNGDNEAETLHALARQALPDRGAELDRLFREGRPDLSLLDSLATPTESYPLLRRLFDAENAVDVGARVLCRKEDRLALLNSPGALEELLRLLAADMGYPAPRAQAADGLLAELGRFVLLSEFAFDLPGELPAALAAYPIAEPRHQNIVFRLCDRMRGSDDTRDGYIELAASVELSLRLPAVCGTLSTLGVRDTFPFEEKVYLQRLQVAVESFQLEEARQVVSQRRQSVWAQLGERAVLWKLAERCLELMSEVLAWRSTGQSKGTPVTRHFREYVAVDRGLWRLDRAQRLVEQGAASCAEDDELAGLVAFCRKRYFEVVERNQAYFLEAVVQAGWPPEGVSRQTQIFDTHVGPALQDGRKVVYFLVDALRFEMGRDLGGRLEERGTCRVEAVASVLPTTTPVGMAALLPGADGRLTLVSKDGHLIPTLGGTPLPDSAARMNFLKSRFGDRFDELTLDELLSSPVKKLEPRLSRADLLVVRTQDIDALGEGHSLHRARRVMTEVLGDLTTATDRLARMGFHRFVYAADHGHILLPELAAGEVVPEPKGHWIETKRRYRLGAKLADAAGVVIMKAGHVGIDAPVAEIAVPQGFKTFSAGEGYFHEGISLQECVLPVVCLEVATPAKRPEMSVQVCIRYRSDRFTSRIIGVKVSYQSITHPTARFRLEAYDGSTAKARQVGEAADCDARDSVTGLVTLETGKELQVPIRIDDDFEGATLEIRATSPDDGTVHDRLKLKNGIAF